MAMRTRTFAPPLTVQVGSAMYTFEPGSDVTVGRGHQSDVRLDVPDGRWVSRKHLVLSFDGTHWVAIDRSRNGSYVDGTRVATVTICDDQAINIGDPYEGPRLVFRVGAPPAAGAMPANTDASHSRTGPERSFRPPRPDQAYPAKALPEMPTHAAPRRLLPSQAQTSPFPARPKHSPTDAPTVPGLPAPAEFGRTRPPTEPTAAQPPRRGSVNGSAAQRPAPRQPPTSSLAPEPQSKQGAVESAQLRPTKPKPVAAPRAQPGGPQQSPTIPPAQLQPTAEQPGVRPRRSLPP